MWKDQEERNRENVNEYKGNKRNKNWHDKLHYH